MSLKTYHLYERFSGTPHDLDIRWSRGCYELTLDGETYATETTRQSINEEANIIINEMNLATLYNVTDL